MEQRQKTLNVVRASRYPRLFENRLPSRRISSLYNIPSPIPAVQPPNTFLTEKPPLPPRDLVPLEPVPKPALQSRVPSVIQTQPRPAPRPVSFSWRPPALNSNSKPVLPIQESPRIPTTITTGSKENDDEYEDIDTEEEEAEHSRIRELRAREDIDDEVSSFIGDREKRKHKLHVGRRFAQKFKAVSKNGSENTIIEIDDVSGSRAQQEDYQ